MITLISNGNFHICYSAGVDQESLDKSVALRFLEEVVCVDLSAYNVSLNWETIPLVITDYLCPGHVKTLVKAHLTNNNSEFTAYIESIDGKFYSYSLSSLSLGTLATKSRHFDNIIELTKFTLECYSLNFNATYCNQLKELLDRITQLNSKQEIETDKAILTCFPSEGEKASFRWCFKMNNIVALEKAFSISIDEGVLSRLSDKWEHYKVASAEVNVFEEEAINIAFGILETDPEKVNVSRSDVELIQKHFKEEGAKIARYEAILRFDNRRGDYFTLDAAWSVIFYYDKLYSYNTDGFIVYIWADNGQIFNVCPQGWYGDSEQTKAPNPLSYGLMALTLAALIVIPITLTLYKKYRHPRNINRTKHVSGKTLNSA